MEFENHECTIGLLHCDGSDELISLEELKQHIEESQAFFDMCLKNPIYHCQLNKPYTLKDYCDKRRNTDITRFDFCPFCGERINWGKIKEK